MNTKNSIWMLAICFLVSACGEKKMDTNLIPFRAGDSTTVFLNKKGEVALRLNELVSEPFSEGLLLVTRKEGKGFLNKKGEVAIQPQYENAGSFHEGIAWVAKKEGHLEAINTQGKTLFTLEQAISARGFQDGLAVFETIDSKGMTQYGCVNKSGKVVIEPQPNEIAGFRAGKSVIVNEENNQMGYIDQKGTLSINYQFEHAGNFSENELACVQFGDKYGVINAKGEYVLNPQFGSISIDGDLFAFSDENQKHGWCDKAGKYVINPQFWYARPFKENDLAAVYDGNQWGYIDRSGHYVIKPQFEEASSFIDNKVAVVALNDKLGLIDKTGKFIVNPQYNNEAMLFHCYEFNEMANTETVYADYLDVNAIVRQVRDMITNEGVDGTPFSSTAAMLIEKYGLTKNSFPKNDQFTLIRGGRLGVHANYTLAAVGNAWKTEYQGWFSSKVFTPDFIPEYYAVFITLDSKHKSKTEQVMRALFTAFHPKEKLEQNTKESQLYTNQGDPVECLFSYDSKGTIQVFAHKVSGME